MVFGHIEVNSDYYHGKVKNSYTSNDNQYDIDIIDRGAIVLCDTIDVHLSYKTQA